jgi:hypothetical protein
MFPQMRQIHKLLVEPQSAHLLNCGEDDGLGLENGTAKDDGRPVFGDFGWDERRVWEYLQTGHRLSPHLLKHMQWNVCEQGTVISPVTAESIRSKQTGQVGSS